MKQLHESTDYIRGTLTSKDESADDILKNDKYMVIQCRECNRSFDSTFTTSDFASLPVKQFEAGTLHLCPHCGNLSAYLLSDYKEPSE